MRDEAKQFSQVRGERQACHPVLIYPKNGALRFWENRWSDKKRWIRHAHHGGDGISQEFCCRPTPSSLHTHILLFSHICEHLLYKCIFKKMLMRVGGCCSSL